MKKLFDVMGFGGKIKQKHEVRQKPMKQAESAMPIRLRMAQKRLMKNPLFSSIGAAAGTMGGGGGVKMHFMSVIAVMLGSVL